MRDILDLRLPKNPAAREFYDRLPAPPRAWTLTKAAYEAAHDLNFVARTAAITAACSASPHARLAHPSLRQPAPGCSAPASLSSLTWGQHHPEPNVGTHAGRAAAVARRRTAATGVVLRVAAPLHAEI